MTHDPRAGLVAEYLDHLTIARRLAEGTRAAYSNSLDELLALIPGVVPAEMLPHHLRQAVVRLRSRGLAGRTIARTLSSWRGFFTWLARHHGLTANPCAGLRAPKTPKSLPKALSPDDTRTLLERGARSPLEVRDKAMFELLLIGTAARRTCRSGHPRCPRADT